MTNYLSGFYHVYSTEEFKKGERKPIWRGMYLRRKTPPIIELAKIYPTISGRIIDMANTYRFFVAPLAVDNVSSGRYARVCEGCCARGASRVVRNIWVRNASSKRKEFP